MRRPAVISKIRTSRPMMSRIRLRRDSLGNPAAGLVATGTRSWIGDVEQALPRAPRPDRTRRGSTPARLNRTVGHPLPCQLYGGHVGFPFRSTSPFAPEGVDETMVQC